MELTSLFQRSTFLFNLSLLGTCCLSLPISVSAQTIENIDTQFNDTFADRVLVSSGVDRIYGELTPVDLSAPDYVTENYLEPGTVDELKLADLTPGQTFFAWITMENSNMDPILGLFDAEGSLIQWDDDSSPTTPLAPALLGTIATDGSLILKVSGIGDDDFDGSETYYYGDEWGNGVDELGDESSVISEPHYQFGDYTLSIITDDVGLQGDVDFFTISGLIPGYNFTIAESMSEESVRLGWITEDGTVAQISHYSAMTNREQIEGIVPATGQLHIAVSGYYDESFDGQHINSGEYVLRVETQPLD